MGQFIQGVVLSDVMIFAIMAAAGLAITFYAFSQREYAGYALGWMAGVFLIILFSTLSPTAALDPALGSIENAAQVNFLATFLPGIVGLLAGFAAIAAINMADLHSYRIVRALTIAAMMCLVLASGYLMLLSPFATRLAIAVFVLGVGISVLFYSIMARYRTKRDELADSQTDEVMIVDAAPQNTTMNRVQRMRQRFREGEQRPLDPR